MSEFPNRNLNQTAVYWANPIDDGYGGFTWDDPIEISCRWQHSSEIVTTYLGEEQLTDSSVQVDCDLDEGGMLLLGTLDDLDSNGFNDPAAVGALAIVRFDKVPTIKADKFYRKAYTGRSRRQ